MALYGYPREHTTFFFVSLHDVGQTQLQIIFFKCLNPVETWSVWQVFEKLHFPIKKSRTIIFFVTVSW